MEHTILFNNKRKMIRLRRRKGMRRMALSVSADGSISLTVPKRTPLWFIEQFLARQKEWIARTLNHFGWVEEGASAAADAERQRFLALRGKALAFVEERLKILNEAYQFSYTRITIRSMKSRWGSCSAAGRLSFNFRLMDLPPGLRDYVLVHELCHVREMNHGRRFWALVSQTVPNYREERRALRAFKLRSESNRDRWIDENPPTP